MSTEPTHTEINTLGQAARQQWPLAEEQQCAIIAQLAALAAGDAKVPGRTRIAAAKALGLFGRLAVEQQKVDARAEERKEPEHQPVDWRDLVLSLGPPFTACPDEEWDRHEAERLAYAEWCLDHTSDAYFWASPAERIAAFRAWWDEQMGAAHTARE